MNRVWPALLLVACTAPDDPGWQELAAERDRLRVLRDRVALVPPDLGAGEARLREALSLVPEMGTVAQTTESFTEAVKRCGGTVYGLAPPRLTAELGLEHQELSATVHGLGLGAPVCAVGRMARGSALIFTESFECTRPRGRVACRVTVASTRFDDTLPDEALPELAAGASDRVRELHAEVRALFEETEAARRVVARAALIEAQLDETQRLGLRRHRHLELADMADALVLGGLEPGRVAFDGDTLFVEGTVPTEAARAQLGAIRSTEHVAIQLGALETDARLAPVEIASLPALGAGDERRRRRKRKRATSVHVYAVDAEAMWLYAALALGEENIVSTTVRGQLVTGHLEAGSARQARAILRATQPGLAIRALDRKALRGRGREVTVEVVGMHTPQLLDLLGNNLGLGMVAPHDLAEVTVVLRNKPADGVVKAVAALLDLDVVRRPGVWLLTPRGGGRLPPGRGPRLDFSAVGVTAAQGLAILDAIDPTGIAVPCDSASAEVWLKNVRHGDAAHALLVNVGMPWPAGEATGCRAEIPAIEVSPVRLLGLAFGDAGAVALVRDAGGAVRLVAGDTTLGNGTHLSVTRIGLEITRPDGETTTLNLRESWPTGRVEDLRGSRLAATLTRDGRAAALLESSNGDWQLIDRCPVAVGRCAITPGRIEVTPAEGNPYRLRLRRRLR